MKTTKMDIDIRPGESITFQDIVSVSLVHKSGQLARLRISAPEQVRIKKETQDKTKL